MRFSAVAVNNLTISFYRVVYPLPVTFLTSNMNRKLVLPVFFCKFFQFQNIDLMSVKRLKFTLHRTHQKVENIFPIFKLPQLIPMFSFILLNCFKLNLQQTIHSCSNFYKRKSLLKLCSRNVEKKLRKSFQFHKLNINFQMKPAFHLSTYKAINTQCHIWRVFLKIFEYIFCK